MPFSPIKLIHKITATCTELFLPRECAGCKTSGQVFCEQCFNTVYQKGAGCVLCNQRNSTGAVCSSCKKSKLIEVGLPAYKAGLQSIQPLKRVLWAGQYRNGLKNAIWQLKYKKRKELAKPLAALLFRKFSEFYPDVLPDRFMVVPIPLHYAKLKERKYNQAELLAREFASLSNLPEQAGLQLCTNILVKTRDTAPQVKAESKEARIKNLENAFEVNLNINASNLRLLTSNTLILIDDVSTTGATLIHASAALQKAGAEKIIGLVAAHG